MAGKVTFAILDNSNEVGTVRFYTPDLGTTNVDTYVSDTPTNALGDMRLALNPLILGNHLRRTVTATVIIDSPTVPADVNAQRERKALVTYRDLGNGKLYRLEIPTFSMVGAVTGTDILDLSHPDWANFVSEFEANFRSELGNAVQVVQAKHVGRSS